MLICSREVDSLAQLQLAIERLIEALPSGVKPTEVYLSHTILNLVETKLTDGSKVIDLCIRA